MDSKKPSLSSMGPPPITQIYEQTIKKHSLPPAEISRLLNKFYYGTLDLQALQTQNSGQPEDERADIFSAKQRSQFNSQPWTRPATELERDFALDMIIIQLVEVQNTKLGTLVKLPEEAIRWLIHEATILFKAQSMMIEMDIEPGNTLNIVGDIHGQYFDLLRIFDHGGYPTDLRKYLFIGDYVDRGKQSIEVISLLLAFKLKYRSRFNLLRGNHECQAINKTYGFYDECKRRYQISLWREFGTCFNCMPVACIVEKRIFCMHGGLSPELHNFAQIEKIKRPTDVPDTGLLCDLLWSDPDKDVTTWGDNERGVSHTFGENIVKKFNEKHDLDLICRAHQVVEKGFEFFADRNLVTVFSAPNYFGEWDNAAAILIVDEELTCKFKRIQPAETKDLLKTDRWLGKQEQTKHPMALAQNIALKA